MNLNKNFLTEVIKYLINRGVTLADVMDTFNEHFNTLDDTNNAIKQEHEKHDEVRKPITDIDLLLCGRSVEESSTPCQKVDNNRDLCQKVEEKAENSEKPVSKSWIDYPKTVKNHGNGVSPARKALFDVVGDKTVIEHLRANGIDYKVYDNRVRRKWSVADACTTPLAPRGRHKSERVIEEPGEPETAVIIPDSVKVVEETSPKMMLVNGRMTEIKVSDTDLVQSSIIEKPVETIETESNTKNTVLATILAANADTNVICLESEKITGTKTVTHAENTTENVTIEPQIKTDTDTRVNDADVNNDVKNDESERIEQLTDKVVRDIVTGKNKEKKKAEPKKDYTMADVCFKLNVTTHELKEMISTGEFPQPDCGNKWSVKLIKEKNLI